MKRDFFAYSREIPVEEECDVFVAGGGMAGVTAAISAARLGAKVILAEMMGCLGGLGTSSLVAGFDPMADGTRAIVGGLMREVVETLYERGELPPHVSPDFWRKNFLCCTPFHPEGLKRLLDQLALSSGVNLRFFTRVIDADVTGRNVKGVVLSQVDGICYVPAKMFVDATGDAYLAHYCGAAYVRAGRDTSRIMPGTLNSLCANIDWAGFWSGREHRKQTDDPRQKPHEPFIPQGIADGVLSQADLHVPGLWQIGWTLGFMNAGHVFGMDALDGQSLSRGLVQGRKLAKEYVDFHRRYVPGCRDMEMVCTAASMGIRESRRVIGEYTLTYDDYLSRRKFPDQIGMFNKFVDSHVYDDSRAEWERFQREAKESGRLQPGECFGIPYGILVPRGWTNLWVAGRCVSCDIKMHHVVRVMPSAGMMGQAAGTAAVQALRKGQSACALDTGTLVETLRANGAILDQEELAGTMTRCEPALLG